MILLIDNYDSFTYNLYQMLAEFDSDIKVVRNDAITLEEIKEMNPDRIVLSPGPKTPKDAGICMDVVRELGSDYPMLGVCLGHQCMGEAYGGVVSHAKNLMHGKSTKVPLAKDILFKDLNNEMVVARYHSLIVEKEDLPDCFQILSESDDGEIMAMKHKTYPMYGLQFHPESILTTNGRKILQNFVEEVSKMTFLEKLMQGQSLSIEEMRDAMQDIMSGNLNDIQIAAFLTALHIKGESVSEIVGGAQVMREFASQVSTSKNTLDTCGTGGDHCNTFNISTAVAFVAAAAGAPVAKHGNRSITSKSGSADVLESLGVNITLTSNQVSECIEEANIGFMFAPKYHGAMKYVMPARKSLGFRTIFNLLGPLANPALAAYQVLGVFDQKYLSTFANVLKEMGTKHALIVHGKDGLDEFTTTDITYVAELKNGLITEYEITPEEFGLKRATLEELEGGTADENAGILRDIFSGAKGPKTDVVLLNAGASLYVSGITESIQEGITLAKELIASGKVLKTLEDLIHVSNKFEV